ncbi:DUF4876 domain-containing protein [Pedobacter aquatilis]|uniref:DUF4876 domain-containing protein n=1 Tax=Pedobacter aquatilis TaxID=351343 RepID=UPI0029301692|nr:DUF4876 domain-containing protein [Pedobacter aquatilis]
MKKSLLPLFACLIVFLAACKKNSLDEVQPVQATFQLSFDAATKDLGLALTNTEITLTNKMDGTINKAKADINGKVVFASIAPGNYSAVASLTVKAADYTTLTGTYIAQDIIFNGSLETNVSATNGALAITLKSGTLGNWVIKQVYYGGSSTTDGAVFRDQFIEIFNNSNEVLYADSLYISQIYGKNTKVSGVDITQAAFQSNGQFNWANAIDMKSTNPNTDYVYLRTLEMIPGTGKTYPVQPGASIIIAQNALNHKASYVGPTGTAYSVKNPALTIDLSTADFETYHGNVAGINPLASDVDNPLVPNTVSLITDGDRDMILNANGYEAIVIFKMKESPLSLTGYASPDVKTITSATTLYKQLPVTSIIDAVDIAHTTASSRAAKRIPDAADAGFTFTPGGSYSSQSVIRKTSTTLGGRRILKDTNNSTADFDYLTIADPTKTVFK